MTKDYAARAVGGTVWHHVSTGHPRGPRPSCRPPDNPFPLEARMARPLSKIQPGKRCRHTGCVAAWSTFDRGRA